VENLYKHKMRKKNTDKTSGPTNFNTKYPNRQWLLVYSDGSYIVDCVNIGDGGLNDLFSFQPLTHGISIWRTGWGDPINAKTNELPMR